MSAHERDQAAQTTGRDHGVTYPRPKTETYSSLAGLGEHLYQKARTYGPGVRPMNHFIGRRTTQAPENPVRVVPREGGGYEVAVIVQGRFSDLEDAQRMANLVRHELNLVWLDFYRHHFGHAEAGEWTAEEVREYEAWRIVPADNDAEEAGR